MGLTQYVKANVYISLTPHHYVSYLNSYLHIYVGMIYDVNIILVVSILFTLCVMGL